MQLEYKYISFVENNLPLLNRKTKVFHCKNKRSGDTLGCVEWYPAWRQYCFMLEGRCVFNSTCLADIQHFIKQLMDERKQPL